MVLSCLIRVGNLFNVTSLSRLIKRIELCLSDLQLFSESVFIESCANSCQGGND